jgi:hypothetical protein
VGMKGGGAVMDRWVEGVRQWLARLLSREFQAAVTRLECDVEEVRSALRNPATIRPLVLAALRDEPAVAAALQPVVEAVLRRNAAPATRQRAFHRNGWAVAAAVALIAILVIPRVAGVSEATAESPLVASAKQPTSVIIEERDDGFGLGDAQVSDAELAQQVRNRLTACKELADARVSFSVKDGWVWLRGEATPRARRAAEEALQDLRNGIFVVNQLVANPTGDAVARR